MKTENIKSTSRALLYRLSYSEIQESSLQMPHNDHLPYQPPSTLPLSHTCRNPTLPQFPPSPIRRNPTCPRLNHRLIGSAALWPATAQLWQYHPTNSITGQRQ